MTSYDDYFLGDIETGEIWSRDEFYKFKFEGYIVSNFMGLVSLLNCLKKENGQLKKNCKNYEWYKQYKALLNENEQLKQSMKEVAELLSDEVDVFSDEAIEHDINAYMELKELDNKDAFYMAKATKTAIKMLKGDDGNA